MPKLGDKTIFVEHMVIIKDLDSLDEQPVCVNIRENTEKTEALAEAAAMRSPANMLAMNGNKLEAEYFGPTGRTLEAEWKWIKQGWGTNKDLTPATLDVDSYFKMD